MTEMPLGSSEAPPAAGAAVATEDERSEARTRVQAKRDFVSHLVAYVVFNAFLVGVWALTGAGYFWPVWILGGWGAGVVMHAWDIFWRRPVGEAEVDRELARRRR